MKRIIKRAILAAVLVILIGIGCYFRFLLPEPIFEVNSYQELSDALKNNPELVLPGEEQLPAEPTWLTVYVPGRFRTSSRAGYAMSIPFHDADISLSCRTLESYQRGGQEIPEFNPNQYLGEMPVQVNSTSVAFHTEACRYFISVDGRDSTLTRDQKMSIAIELAQALVDQILTQN